MRKTEVLRVLAILKVAYPRFFVSNDKAETEMQAVLWQELLGDIPPLVLKRAVERLIVASTFPPSISEVRRAALDLLRPRTLGAGEAWGEVTEAMRKYGQYRPHEAVASLSPLTARVVRALGFVDLCVSENAVADRAHFLRMYEEMAERELKEAMLPENLRYAVQAGPEPRVLATEVLPRAARD